MDPSVAPNTLRSSARYRVVFIWPAWPVALPTSYRPNHHPTDHPLIGHPLCCPRKKVAFFADGRLGGLTSCLLEGLGVRNEMVGALSALEANAP